MNLRLTKIETRLTERTPSGRSYEKGVIYFFPQGENLADNLINRRNRPYEVYKTHLDQVLAEAKKNPAFPQNVTAADFVWRQNAGCECGCSPGFIKKGFKLSHNVFVDFEVA
jgi:hypothetical protein